MHLDGLFHHRLNVIYDFLEGFLRISPEIRLKIPRDLHLTVLVSKIVPRLQTEHPFKKRLVCRHKLEREIITQRIFIKYLIKFRMLHKGFNLRCKQKTSIHLRIVKRFDAKDISRTKKPLLLRIPDHKSIHAAESVHQLLAPLLISVNQRLRIRVGYKRVASFNQLVP